MRSEDAVMNGFKVFDEIFTERFLYDVPIFGSYTIDEKLMVPTLYLFTQHTV